MGKPIPFIIGVGSRDFLGNFGDYDFSGIISLYYHLYRPPGTIIDIVLFEEL